MSILFEEISDFEILIFLIRTILRMPLILNNLGLYIKQFIHIYFDFFFDKFMIIQLLSIRLLQVMHSFVKLLSIYDYENQ